MTDPAPSGNAEFGTVEFWADKIEQSVRRVAGGARRLEVLLPARHPAVVANPVTGPDFHGSVLLSGSFDPLHDGHLEIAAVAQSRLARPVWFELSIRNAEKRPLRPGEARQRLLPALLPSAAPRATPPGPGFHPHGLLLTNAATFAEKAKLFPGCWFAIGVDTLRRVASPQFYGPSTEQRDAALRQITDAGCRFLVFGRIDDEQFRELADVTLPRVLRDACTPVSEIEFRNDISSTQIRRSQQILETLRRDRSANRRSGPDKS